MITITSKWAGKCAACKGAIAKDETIRYDSDNKKAYHAKCDPGGQAGTIVDAADGHALADRLGFIRPGEDVRADWPMWNLHKAD
jgi:hypothetical protein